MGAAQQVKRRLNHVPLAPLDRQTFVQKHRPFRPNGLAKGYDVALLIEMYKEAGVAIVEPLDQGAEMSGLMVGEDQIRDPHGWPAPMLIVK